MRIGSIWQFARIVGKRLMFDQLTGKVHPAPTDNSEAAVA
jgi:hypothetical protein